MYFGLIFAWTIADPTAAPGYVVQPASATEKLRLIVRDILPMTGAIVFTVGVMVTGIATPTEAAAIGCVTVLVLAIAYRSLTFGALRASVAGSLRVTVMAFLIIFGSATFSQILAFSGASSGLIGWATSFDVSPMSMLLLMMLVLLLLGCFMDQLSMMLLTAPIFFPLATSLGFDLTWFALLMLLTLEIGFTTPPFGLLLFVMKGVSPPGTTMKDIYLAATPFILCVFVLIGLIIAFPPIATWLPGAMK